MKPEFSPGFGVKNRLTGVPAGGVLGEHRLAVGAPQFGGLVEQRRRLHRQRMRGRDGERGDLVREFAVQLRRYGRHLGAEQPLCFAYAGEYAPKNIRGRFIAGVQLIGGAFSWP